jgi:hypothetical protein
MSDSAPSPAPLGAFPALRPDDPGATAQMQAIMQAALHSTIPRLYVNSVGMLLTNTDLVITMFWNNIAVANVNITLPFAKGLAEDLNRAVADYERLSGQTIQPSGIIAATMQQRSQSATDAA